MKGDLLFLYIVIFPIIQLIWLFLWLANAFGVAITGQCSNLFCNGILLICAGIPSYVIIGLTAIISKKRKTIMKVILLSFIVLLVEIGVPLVISFSHREFNISHKRKVAKSYLPTKNTTGLILWIQLRCYVCSSLNSITE